MKGRPREQWQHDLEKLSLSDSVAEIKKRGFAGIYVSRPGYTDGLPALEGALRAVAVGDIIDSTERDLFFVRLR
jgi:hypothetical protein